MAGNLLVGGRPLLTPSEQSAVKLDGDVLRAWLRDLGRPQRQHRHADGN